MPPNSGFTLDQCRKMAQDAKDARDNGSLRPMAEFDPERILWLIEQIENQPPSPGPNHSPTLTP